MRRLVSLDVARGMAIVSVVFFHALVFNNDATLTPETTPAPWLLALLTYLVTWAGTFATVSGLGNTLSLYGRLRQGRIDRRRMLQDAVFGGLAIVAINYLYLALFTPGFIRVDGADIGWLPGLVRSGQWLTWPADRLLFCTALMMIGWGKVGTGLAIYLLTRGNRAPRPILGYAVVTLLATALVWTYPLVKAALRPLIVRPLTVANLPLDLVLTWLIGPMDPIFPYVGFALYGVVMGLMLVDQVSQRVLLGYGYGAGAIYSAIALWFYARHGFSANAFDIPDLGPLIQVLGPMLVLFTAFIQVMDLGSDRTRQRWWRWTRTFRTFGLVSLSVFLLEGTLSALLRRLVALVAPDFTHDPGFLFVIFAPLSLLLWIVLVKLWARFDFAGSAEWLVVRASARITGQRSVRLDAQRLLRTSAAYLESGPES